MAACSKAWIVFAHSNAGVVGSNSIRGMDVCMYVDLFCVCTAMCVGSGLAKGWSPTQGALPNVYRIMKLKNAARAQQRAVVSLMNERISE
jgi:hypothetical protein